MNMFYRFTRFSLKIFFLLLYRHEIYGSENLIAGKAIIVANHASFFDPPLVAVSNNEEIHFLARASLFKKPILGFVIRHLNAYPLTGTSRDLTSFKLVSSLLQQGKKVLLFPEGVRTFDGKISPLKSGIGLLSIKNECPIIPTLLYGTYGVWNRHRKYPKPFGKTACVFGKPIYPEAFMHLPKKEAQELIASEVTKALNDLQDEYKKSHLA
jgi:1-acyl-sn-glycerol-3-phosphate acyltransferase